MSGAACGISVKADLSSSGPFLRQSPANMCASSAAATNAPRAIGGYASPRRTRRHASIAACRFALSAPGHSCIKIRPARLASTTISSRLPLRVRIVTGLANRVFPTPDMNTPKVFAGEEARPLASRASPAPSRTPTAYLLQIARKQRGQFCLWTIKPLRAGCDVGATDERRIGRRGFSTSYSRTVGNTPGQPRTDQVTI
jgi:hypothetical protein